MPKSLIMYFNIVSLYIVHLLDNRKTLRRKLITSNGKLPQGKSVVDYIAITVLVNLADSNVFLELNEHSLETPIQDEYHIFKLIKAIAKCYTKVRFYQLGREETERSTEEKIRKKKTKELVLFKNQ